jgi:hypothetical protein
MKLVDHTLLSRLRVKLRPTQQEKLNFSKPFGDFFHDYGDLIIRQYSSSNQILTTHDQKYQS